MFKKADVLAKQHGLNAHMQYKKGIPNANHIAWYVHKQTSANVVVLYVNVAMLKKKATTYYQFIADIKNCFLAG